MFDVFDSTLHPIETTILQLRIIASHKSGIPLSAFRLVTVDGTNKELFDHVRLSQYDIGLFYFNNNKLNNFKDLILNRLSCNINYPNMDGMVGFFYLCNKRLYKSCIEIS
jgi:hypothetical protein